ncbi:MAG: hypothetical protein GY801_33690 [bacterium]|nr:hypothetical protein [bacterium]
MFRALGQLAANIPAACVGGGVFMLALIPLELGFFLACMLGLSGYVIAGTWIWPARSFPGAGVRTASSAAQALFRDSEMQLAQMRAQIAKIRSARLHETAGYITDIAENILDALRNLPGDGRVAQQFASYYLVPANNIFRHYLESATQEDRRGLAERIELILDSVQLAFEKQLSNVMQDGTLYLDLEVAALEETLNGS